MSLCTVGRSSVFASPPSIYLLAHQTTSSAPLLRGACCLASVDRANSGTAGSSCDHPVPPSPAGEQAVNEALLRRLQEMQLSSSKGSSAASPTLGNTHSMDNPRPHTHSLRQRRLDLASIPMLSSRGAYLPPSTAHHEPATTTSVPKIDQSAEPSEAHASSEPLSSSTGAVTNSSSTPVRSPLPASPTQPADTGWRQILEQARQQQQQHRPQHLPLDSAPVHHGLSDTFG